jgi:2-polyprenyl-6-methoxyphenol hydroxylase-like FAD-dependent oxidoreductase
MADIKDRYDGLVIGAGIAGMQAALDLAGQGFHVLLVPFTALGSVEWGVRTAALVLTLVLVGTFRAVLLRHEVTGAEWWTLAFFLAVK